MASENDFSKLVTEFLLNTCRLCPPSTIEVLDAVVNCVAGAAMQPPAELEASNISQTTGSVAEFYIEPMLSCVGDIDIMYHRSTSLAIPAGHQSPTQLPADFHSYVRLFKIIDSEWPGYVYLRLNGLLSECTDEYDDRYTVWQSERQQIGHYLTYDHPDHEDNTVHGPAEQQQHMYRCWTVTYTARLAGLVHSVEYVYCVRCLVWPPQAVDWPTRHRKFDWPDSPTVDRVVSNGCDVVQVAHRQCRQSEMESEFQWRLSFSRAEVVLLNSWMPVQQIVYHMLRVFVKTERVTDSADNSGTKILSNYHVKTLMLWACELKPRDWWIERSNLVRTCTKLLHTLAVWLNDAHCQHYFISNCNLLHDDGSCRVVAGQLLCLTESWLSTWFVHNYIKRCARLCPRNVSPRFDLLGCISTTTNLQKAASAVVNWRISTVRDSDYSVFASAVFTVADRIHSFSLTARSIWQWTTERRRLRFSQNLDTYFISIALLHVAQKTAASNRLSHELSDVLAAISIRNTSTVRQLCRMDKRSRHLLRMAEQFMTKIASNESHSTLERIQIELAKAYLHRALSCKDSDSDSIYCLANVYLAVLYYTTGQYQTAIDHCTLVTRSQDHSRSSSRVVDGSRLLKIDDDIDNVLGLVVFYQSVRAAALNQQQQTQHLNVFTTNFFASCLCTRCLSANRDCTTNTGRHRGSKQHKTRYRYTSIFTELLLRCATEHLTKFRHWSARYFGPVVTFVTTDFEALYAYRCGEYQHCLQLCRQNVRTLVDAVRTNAFYAYPEFIQLLDDEMVSLAGLALTVKSMCTDDDRFVTTYVSQRTLSLYLLTQCQLKLRHSATSLAETLDFVERAWRRPYPVYFTLDQLTLKLTERRI